MTFSRSSLIAFLAVASLAAQQAPAPPVPDSPYDLRGLTIDPGPHEPRHLLDTSHPFRYVEPYRANPVAPRMIAEWEPVQAALIRYPLGISVDAVKTIASELKVYVLCASSSQSSATSAFQNAGVNMSNVSFVNTTTDTYWTRDYGPWWITAEENGQRVVRLVDVVYRANGERPNDDRVPQVLAGTLNMPTYYNLNFVCQGGNVMADSRNVGASTDRLKDENPNTAETTLKQMAKTTVGFSTYYVMTDPGYPEDYIKHIDCWAKFISPTTVLVKRVPTSDASYSKYETAAEQWKNRTNAAGQKYNVVRIDGPSEAPYVNHVILNDRVFVPVMTSENDATDKAALDQIRAAYGSGYRVIGVKAASNNPWLGTDSIHCRVNSIPVFSGLSDQTPQSLALSSLQNQTVADGSSVTFSVTASGGTAPYSYQWLKGGSAISGATGATYTFVAKASDAGSYSVRVTDSASPAASATSNAATLTVTTQPSGNLALNKKATASGQYSSSNSPAKAVDGSTSTYWAVAVGNASQWLSVDLGAAQSVGRAVVQWSATNYPKSVAIQVQEGSTWKTVTTGTNSRGGTQTYTFAPVSGRAWRILASQPNSAYYTVYELQLFNQ